MSDIVPPDTKCHHTGFEKSCRELVLNGKCKRWTHLMGRNPFNGDIVDNWDCIDNHALMLQGHAARAAENAEAANLLLRNMIFDPEVRAKELARSQDLKAIAKQ